MFIFRAPTTGRSSFLRSLGVTHRLDEGEEAFIRIVRLYHITCSGRTVEKGGLPNPFCCGASGFFSKPSFQLRKCRPAPRFSTFRQTLTPEFDQRLLTSIVPNAEDDLFLKLRVFGSPSRAESCEPALRFSFGKEGGNGNRSRSWGLHL